MGSRGGSQELETVTILGTCPNSSWTPDNQESLSQYSGSAITSATMAATCDSEGATDLLRSTCMSTNTWMLASFAFRYL